MSTGAITHGARGAAMTALVLAAALVGGCGSDAPRASVTTTRSVATGFAPVTTVLAPGATPASAAVPLTSTVVVTLPPSTVGPDPTRPAATLPPTTIPATTTAATAPPAPGTTATNVELTVATVRPPATTAAPAAPPGPSTTIVVDGLALAPCIDEDRFQLDQRAPRGQVALYQFTLDRLGYDPGDIDGYFGPNTFDAAADEILDHSPDSGRELFLDEGVVAAPAFRRLGIACPGG